MILYIHTDSIMKGYITVKLAAEDLPQYERIGFEVRYAAELQRLLGGEEVVFNLCAQAANDGVSPLLREAARLAEQAALMGRLRPAHWKFCLQVWRAQDL